MVPLSHILWMWHTVLWKMSENKNVRSTSWREWGRWWRREWTKSITFVTSVSLLTSPTTFDTLKMRSHPGKYLEQWKWLNSTYLSRWNMRNISYDQMHPTMCCYGIEMNGKEKKTCRNGTMRAVQARAKEKNSSIVYNVLKCSLHFRIDAVECNTMQANHSICFYYWKWLAPDCNTK